jgi:Na+-transporting methylmalonyl-CoA/oxaloacetate decarboxylase gamma subunit
MFGLMRPQKSCHHSGQKSVARMHYCGTCKTIGQEFGHKSRMSLNYDAVFLAELLTSLSDQSPNQWNNALQASNKCFTMPRQNEKSPAALRYAAASNVFLAALKIDDNIRDKVGKRYKIMRWLLNDSFKKASQQLSDFGLNIDYFWQKVEAQQALEAQARRDFDNLADALAHYAQPTADMTAALFERAAHAISRPELAPLLSQIGQLFGQIVYALDAFEDLEKDIYAHQFNPLTCFFIAEDGQLSSADLEAVRNEILSQQAALQSLFACLPISAEQVEMFDNRLVANLALRLYRERVVPVGLRQRIRQRWTQAQSAANRLLCQPDSWAKKLQLQALSVLFFALPMLSVETSASQDKSQIWSAMAILTALLATVGLSKKALLPIEPKAKTKGSLWQRVKNRLGFGKDKHKAMCEYDECCGDCGEICLYTTLVILGISLYIFVISVLIQQGFMIAALIMIGIPIFALIIFLIVRGISNYIYKKQNEEYQKEQDIKAKAKEEQAKAENAKNLERINTFFAQNALRPEVVTLPSGLQYEILNQGDPSQPVAKNTQVRIRYNSDLNNLDIASKQDLAIWQKPFNFTDEIDINKLLPNVGSTMRLYYPPQHPKANPYHGLYYEIKVLDSKYPNTQITPSGLEYVIHSEGNPTKPATDAHIIKYYKNCKGYGSDCDDPISAPSWFKAGSFEQEALSLMKNVGASYSFYLPNPDYTKISFKITITDKKLE